MKTKQRSSNTGRPDRKILAEIVRCIVETAKPDKIILFGSAARSEMGPDSDIDLLVI
jgi:predicted nucleotidyltransferase